jgi:hypothetical protein
MMKLVHLRLLTVLWVGSSVVLARPVDFIRDVRPLFETHCYECHGEKKQKSGLRLDLKSAGLKGGDQYAPNILAGRANESSLIRLVTSHEKDAVSYAHLTLPTKLL